MMTRHHEDLIVRLKRERDEARAENERLRGALKTIKRTIEARSELFISDSACLFNLHDRARAALHEDKS